MSLEQKMIMKAVHMQPERDPDNGGTYGGGGWNLLGNPYTSAISVSDFITANYNPDPDFSQFDPNYVALYLYNKNDYNYVTSIHTGWPGGTELRQDNVQAGQGFFVLAMNDNSSFTFNRAMQEHANGDLLLKSAKVTDRWPGLQLKIKYGELENRTTIVFYDEMTVGLDPGFDIGLMSSGSDAVIYTALAQDNGINFARQALPVNGSVKNIVPVGVDYYNGGKITFSADIEQLRNYKFWLEDRETGIFTDLGANSYTVTLPSETYGTGRFFVHVGAGRSYQAESS